MKINTLEMTNFRNHHATKIELDNINIFVGRNNSGKSSIKAAIEYALTGRCGWTDGAGRGAERLVRHGAAGASIMMNVGGLGAVSRNIPNALQVKDWTGSLKLQQEKLYEELGAGADVITAVLNTRRFLDMNSDEQKNTLFRLMGLSFPDKKSIIETLNAYLNGEGKESLLTADFYTYIDKHIPIYAVGGPEALDAVYKEIYKERTAAKKILKELETLAAGSKQESTLPAGALENKARIQADLQQLKDRKEELLQLRGQAAGKQDLIDRLTGQSKDLSIKYEELYEELDRIQFDLAELDELEKALPKLAKKVESAENSLAMQNDLIAGHKANLDSWAAARDKFTDKKQTMLCALVPELKCTADIEAILDQLNRKIDAVAGHYERQKQEAAVLEKTLRDVREKYDQAQARVDELRATQERMKKIAGDIQEVDRQREAVREELEQVEKSAAFTPEMEAEIEQLSQRIPKGEELLRQIAAEERVLAENKRVAGSLERVKREVAWLEVLVEAFGPKGMKTSLLASIVGNVQEVANGRLAMLTGGNYQVQFNVEKGFEIKVTVGGSAVDVNDLSTSERMRLGIIMQDVLSGLTGLRLLIIDDCEILDPVNKGMLINLLLQIRDDYDTIIILSALGETQPRHPGIPGLAMFLVEDGAVHPLPAPVAA